MCIPHYTIMLHGGPCSRARRALCYCSSQCPPGTTSEASTSGKDILCVTTLVTSMHLGSPAGCCVPFLSFARQTPLNAEGLRQKAAVNETKCRTLPVMFRAE